MSVAAEKEKAEELIWWREISNNRGSK